MDFGDDVEPSNRPTRLAGQREPSRLVAALTACGAYVVPYLLSRSSTPSPDHPRIYWWYRSLKKPSFNPPDVAVPVAWLAIESGLAGSAYRLLRCSPSPERSRALWLLAGNVVSIGAWSRLFFRRQNLPLSTVASAGLGVLAATYTLEARKVDRPAAAAGLTLTLWVGFATILTAEIWRQNRRSKR